MTRLIPTFLLLTGMLLLSGNGLFSQEKKDDPAAQDASLESRRGGAS